MKSLSICLLASLLLVIPQVEAALVYPGHKTEIEWTKREKAEPIAKRLLEEDKRARHYVVRLTASEEPHVHDQDLTVFVLEGKIALHIEDKLISVSEGDVVRIPQGTRHWAEVSPGSVVEVYAIYVTGP